MISIHTDTASAPCKHPMSCSPHFELFNLCPPLGTLLLSSSDHHGSARSFLLRSPLIYPNSRLRTTDEILLPPSLCCRPAEHLTPPVRTAFCLPRLAYLLSRNWRLPKRETVDSRHGFTGILLSQRGSRGVLSTSHRTPDIARQGSLGSAARPPVD